MLLCCLEDPAGVWPVGAEAGGAAEELAVFGVCRRCKQEIIGLGYHLRPIGTADEMLTSLELDAELTGSGTLDPELGAALAEGWNSCIPCVAAYGAEMPVRR